MHVDLDHDEVTWPPLPAAATDSPGKGGKGEEVKTPDFPGFGFGKEGGEGQAGAGEVGEADGRRGAPPVWPEEAARRARRVVQSILFPEFESFDAVSERLDTFLVTRDVVLYVLEYACMCSLEYFCAHCSSRC